MSCNLCKTHIDINELYRDGQLYYCYLCVSTKRIDDETKFLPLNEQFKWDYCEYCKNIINPKMLLGSCDFCSYKHICKDCGNKYFFRQKSSICCLTCIPRFTLMLKNLPKENTNNDDEDDK